MSEEPGPRHGPAGRSLRQLEQHRARAAAYTPVEGTTPPPWLRDAPRLHMREAEAPPAVTLEEAVGDDGVARGLIAAARLDDPSPHELASQRLADDDAAARAAHAPHVPLHSAGIGAVPSHDDVAAIDRAGSPARPETPGFTVEALPGGDAARSHVVGARHPDPSSAGDTVVDARHARVETGDAVHADASTSPVLYTSGLASCTGIAVQSASGVSLGHHFGDEVDQYAPVPHLVQHALDHSDQGPVHVVVRVAEHHLGEGFPADHDALLHRLAADLGGEIVDGELHVAGRPVHVGMLVASPEAGEAGQHLTVTRDGIVLRTGDDDGQAMTWDEAAPRTERVERTEVHDSPRRPAIQLGAPWVMDGRCYRTLEILVDGEPRRVVEVRTDDGRWVIPHEDRQTTAHVNRRIRADIAAAGNDTFALAEVLRSAHRKVRDGFAALHALVEDGSTAHHVLVDLELQHRIARLDPDERAAAQAAYDDAITTSQRVALLAELRRPRRAGPTDDRHLIEARYVVDAHGNPVVDTLPWDDADRDRHAEAAAAAADRADHRADAARPGLPAAERDLLRNEARRASERMGEAAGVAYARARFPGYRIYVQQGANALDLILVHPDTGDVVVIECKGGSRSSGQRRDAYAPDHYAAEQGSAAYLDSMAHTVAARPLDEDDADQLDAEQAFHDAHTAFRDGAPSGLRYIQVFQPVDEHGQLTPIEAREFDLRASEAAAAADPHRFQAHLPADLQDVPVRVAGPADTGLFSHPDQHAVTVIHDGQPTIVVRPDANPAVAMAEEVEHVRQLRERGAGDAHLRHLDEAHLARWNATENPLTLDEKVAAYRARIALEGEAQQRLIDAHAGRDDEVSRQIVALARQNQGRLAADAAQLDAIAPDGSGAPAWLAHPPRLYQTGAPDLAGRLAAASPEHAADLGSDDPVRRAAALADPAIRAAVHHAFADADENAGTLHHQADALITTVGSYEAAMHAFADDPVVSTALRARQRAVAEDIARDLEAVYDGLSVEPVDGNGRITLRFAGHRTDVVRELIAARHPRLAERYGIDLSDALVVVAAMDHPTSGTVGGQVVDPIREVGADGVVCDMILEANGGVAAAGCPFGFQWQIADDEAVEIVRDVHLTGDGDHDQAWADLQAGVEQTWNAPEHRMLVGGVERRVRVVLRRVDEPGGDNTATLHVHPGRGQFSSHVMHDAPTHPADDAGRQIVVAHELAHLLFGLPDTYEGRTRPRTNQDGEVVPGIPQTRIPGGFMDLPGGLMDGPRRATTHTTHTVAAGQTWASLAELHRVPIREHFAAAGIARPTPEQVLHYLQSSNPHLFDDATGAFRELRPGDEIRVVVRTVGPDNHVTRADLQWIESLIAADSPEAQLIVLGQAPIGARYRQAALHRATSRATEAERQELAEALAELSFRVQDLDGALESVESLVGK